MSRVRVLCLTNALGGGGAEMHVVRLANALDRSRFEVSVAVLRRDSSYEQLLAADIALHVLPGRRARAVIALRRLLRRTRVQIVYSCLDLSNCLAIAATRGMWRRPAVVISVQAPPSILYRGAGGWAGLLVRLMRVSYPRSDLLIASSRGLAADVAAFLRRRPPMSVIGNAGVDDRVRDAARSSAGEIGRCGIRRRGRLVVACGRLVDQKGFDVLIRAFRTVVDTVPAELRIIGEGEQRQQLEALVQDLDLGDAVSFVGWDPNPYATMCQADAFALSSRFEGFGNVLVEAMACGLPVVATSCPYGPDEIVTDGVSGLLVEPGNEAALAGALICVLEDGELRSRLAIEGRRRAEDFDSIAIATQHATAFEAAQLRAVRT